MKIKYQTELFPFAKGLFPGYLKMKELRIALTIVVLALSSHVFAQPDIEDVRIRSSQDAAEHNEEVLESSEWVLLSDNPSQSESWDAISLFILNWARFTDEYPIRMRTELTPFMKRNPELMTVYLAGWVDFAMKNPESADSETACTTAALTSCIDYYQGNKDHLHDDTYLNTLEEYKSAGTLKTWVMNQLAELNELGDR